MALVVYAVALPAWSALVENARAAKDRAVQTLVWLAFGLSIILIAFAAIGVLDPLRGALAQSVAVLLVVANSARILRFSGSGGSTTSATAAEPVELGRRTGGERRDQVVRSYVK